MPHAEGRRGPGLIHVAMPFIAGFGIAIPDLVPVNAGLGVQVAILGAGATAALVYLADPSVPRRIFREPLLLLGGVFVISLLAILAQRGVGAAPVIAKWARQMVTFSAMLLIAVGLLLAMERWPLGRRALTAGVSAGGVFTVLTSLLFLAAFAVGLDIRLWHNNSSFMLSAASLPTVSIRDELVTAPRLYGFFTEPSFFAAYAAPVGAFLTGLRFFKPASPAGGIATTFTGVALLVLAMFVSSRTGTVAGLFAVGAIVLARYRARFPLRVMALVSVFIAPVALALVPLLAADSLASADISVLQRTAAAIVGFSELKAHPLLGAGFGAFGFAYAGSGEAAVIGLERLLSVVLEQQNEGAALANPYNLVVRIAAETGGLGLLALGWFVLSLVENILAGSTQRRAASLGVLTFLVAGIDSFVMLQFWVLWALSRAHDEDGR